MKTDIRLLTSKLDEPAESIDEVIILLDYIEIVRRPDSKVDEIANTINSLKTKMEFLLELEIMLDSDAFKEYL